MVGGEGCNDEKVQGLRSSGEFREVVASGRDQLCSWQAGRRLGWILLPLLSPPPVHPSAKQASARKGHNQPSHSSPDPASERQPNYHVRPILTTTINILTPRIEGETMIPYRTCTVQVTRLEKLSPSQPGPVKLSRSSGEAK